MRLCTLCKRVYGARTTHRHEGEKVKMIPLIICENHHVLTNDYGNHAHCPQGTVFTPREATLAFVPLLEKFGAKSNYRKF